MTQETPMTGGRITKGVVRIGDTVRRPPCANAHFVHSVLLHLDKAGADCAPCYLGIDEQGREILTYLPGSVPSDLGCFTDEQCMQAAAVIRRLHSVLSSHPDCPAGLTVCHNDLSPCNFVFNNSIPYAVIDWDAASIGDAQDDLAYAAWMWLDIGNAEQDPAFVLRRLRLFLDAYGLCSRTDFVQRMVGQMQRVGRSVFPTPEQSAAVQRWAQSCILWTNENLTGIRL